MFTSVYEYLYDFNAMNEFAIHQSNMENISMDEYVANEIQGYLQQNNEILADMAASNDVEAIDEFIDQLTEVRVNVYNFQLYDLERKMKPEERR